MMSIATSVRQGPSDFNKSLAVALAGQLHVPTASTVVCFPAPKIPCLRSNFSTMQGFMIVGLRSSSALNQSPLQKKHALKKLLQLKPSKK